MRDEQEEKQGMIYTSTRDDRQAVSSAQAIVKGLAPGGGLFVPTQLPAMTRADLTALCDMDYPQRAAWVLSRFLDDFSEQELEESVRAAYVGRFDDDRPAPISGVGERFYLLELWHGPTCAFKDMALQLLPELLSRAAAKTGCDKEIVILTATSGDTGKAALEGFRDRRGVKIQVYYPTDGVSAMQKRQMTSQQGANVSVVGVRGNFDQCQSGVKAIFGDAAFALELNGQGCMLSSANSINWGRLVPQIVYYISAWCDLFAEGKTDFDTPVNFCVPTGNFGNILAAFYAKRMGLPVGKLICASNRNNVLTDFIRTGRYDRRRPFYATTSPSMDILISSNLERLLSHLLDGGCTRIAALMQALAQEGAYEITPEERQRLQELFWGGFCTDEAAAETIRKTFEGYSYLLDPHTAVAVNVAEQYRKESGDDAPLVVISTASPYKFPGSVLRALGTPEVSGNDLENLSVLEKLSGTPCPAPLSALVRAEIRFQDVCEAAEMPQRTRDFLGGSACDGTM